MRIVSKGLIEPIRPLLAIAIIKKEVAPSPRNFSLSDPPNQKKPLSQKTTLLTPFASHTHKILESIILHTNRYYTLFSSFHSLNPSLIIPLTIDHSQKRLYLINPHLFIHPTVPRVSPCAVSRSAWSWRLFSKLSAWDPPQRLKVPPPSTIQIPTPSGGNPVPSYQLPMIDKRRHIFRPLPSTSKI